MGTERDKVVFADIPIGVVLLIPSNLVVDFLAVSPHELI